MRYYIGLIHKEADSDYGVSFPDFPGVATAGTSLDDAQAMAEEALALHVDGLVEDGEALPEPSTLDAVMELPDSKGGVAIRVAVKTEAPKCIRVNITLPEDILERVDKCATSRGTYSVCVPNSCSEARIRGGIRLSRHDQSPAALESLIPLTRAKISIVCVVLHSGIQITFCSISLLAIDSKS